MQFYYFDANYIETKDLQGFVSHVEANKAHYKVQKICRYSEAPKFVAHNHME